jgi:psp operon transcriptional activator
MEALGESEAFLDFQQQLSRVAGVDRPVLIVGERGTGKELVASRLHYLSGRWQGPLVTLNCSALAPSLLEAELFGHESGAFTGATRMRRGRFEAAHEGTLFLDEIGLIPVEVQEKILRVVEYATFERVGSSEAIGVNVRIIGATNANLPRLATEGRFKVDLLDRLSFEVLHLPPLRERHGDIMLLADHFAARMAAELGWPHPPEFSEEAVRALEDHAWPGNIRELKNVVERAVYRSEGDVIRSIQFNPFGSPGASIRSTSPSSSSETTAAPAQTTEWKFPLGQFTLSELLERLEISALQQALRQSRNHQGKAARLLGLGYHQFRALYRKHRAKLDE